MQLCKAARTSSHALTAADDDPDPWFAAAAVDLPLLRRRAFNFRWAEKSPDVLVWAACLLAG
jgi:hypothetical protein